MGELTLVAWLVAATLFGLWACGVTARALGEKDPSAVVWDEIVALWWVLLLLPERFDLQLVAVLLFRLFDIAKPWPIGAVERRFSGGVGIMIDDLVAAAMTLLVVATARHYTLLP
jgi:phosphatidylglycerophosphatase A